MAINILAYGITEYLSQLLNVFDGFVVIVRYGRTAIYPYLSRNILTSRNNFVVVHNIL